MKYFIGIIIGFFLSATSFAGNPVTGGPNGSGPVYEITELDITNLEKIESEQISVMGIRLGMTIEKVKLLVAYTDDIYLQQDKFNNNRFYLFDYRMEDGEHVPLAYLKWDNQKDGLDEIILYEGFRDYMAGNSKKLLTPDVLNFSSSLVKDFLGYPYGKKVILNVTSLDLVHTSYFYDQKEFQIIKQVSGDRITYALGFFLTHPAPEVKKL